MAQGQDISARIAAVKARLPIADVIERTVKLSGASGSTRRRGKCPFHSGNSASFAVSTGGASPGNGFAHCFGCRWHGDVIGFVRDQMGMSFVDALAECEIMAGLAGRDGAAVEARGPVVRERNPAARRQRETIEPIDMARWIWPHARPDHAAVRRYFMGRGIPAGVLTDARLSAFRFMGECPIVPWDAGGGPRGGLNAPAVIAMVTRPELDAAGVLVWRNCGLHVTFLAPDGAGTMVRRKPWAKADDEDPMFPKRKMLGPVGGGCVVLGKYDAGAALFVGEGNETVLSGMMLAGAGDDAVGIATLSLDNLQGAPKLWQTRTGGRIWPLFAIEPDADKPPFVVPGHRGAVTGLVDSDMTPLRGRRDPKAGGFLGESVVERRRGPIVNRAITGAERAAICADLFVKGWRRAGVHGVTAIRAPLGMDFNDVMMGAGA